MREPVTGRGEREDNKKKRRPNGAAGLGLLPAGISVAGGAVAIVLAGIGAGERGVYVAGRS